MKHPPTRTSFRDTNGRGEDRQGLHDVSTLRDRRSSGHNSHIDYAAYANTVYTKYMTKHTEEFKVNGEDLLKKVKEIIAEGNARKITVKSKEGKSIVELPLTIGVVGAALAPLLAAVGAIAALVTECTIVVEREEK